MKKNLKQKIKGSDFLKMKESDKANLIILAIFVSCFLLGYLILMPRVSLYKRSKISIEESKLLKTNLEEKADILKGLGEKVIAEEAFVRKTKNVLPEEPQVPELLLMIDKLAIKNSLYMNTFAPVIEEPQENVKKTDLEGQKKIVPWRVVNLQFDIVGKYPNIKEFIKNLEQNIRPLDIVSINISEGGDLTSEDKTLRFHIGAKAYYQEKLASN